MPRITEVFSTGGAADDLQGVFERESSGDYARGEEFLLAADAALELLKRFPEKGASVGQTFHPTQAGSFGAQTTVWTVLFPRRGTTDRVSLDRPASGT